jgi:UDP-N-acetylmuramate dehydrogenase
MHCGFIVNVGNATAKEVIELIKLAHDTVLHRFGVKLETELRIIGEE